MRINQVVVIPEYDEYDFGRREENYCEHDIISGYMESLIEFLDYDGVSLEVKRRDSGKIFPNTMIIYCRSGWGTPVNGTNFSTVYFSKPSKKASEFMIESISEWGKCYVDTAHQTRERKLNGHAYGDIDDTMALVIDPFVPGGPRHEDYMLRLPKLGEMMAQAVFGLLTERKEIRA